MGGFRRAHPHRQGRHLLPPPRRAAATAPRLPSTKCFGACTRAPRAKSDRDRSADALLLMHRRAVCSKVSESVRVEVDGQRIKRSTGICGWYNSARVTFDNAHLGGDITRAC